MESPTPSLSSHLPTPLLRKTLHFPACHQYSMCPEQNIAIPSMEKHVPAAAPVGMQRAALLAHPGAGCLSQTMAWCRSRCTLRSKAQGDTDPRLPADASGSQSEQPNQHLVTQPRVPFQTKPPLHGVRLHAEPFPSPRAWVKVGMASQQC